MNRTQPMAARLINNRYLKILEVGLALYGKIWASLEEY